MEKGFFHPDRGYWQTTGEPPQHILDGYPQGTVDVPLKPSGFHKWNGREWVLEIDPPTSAEVNAERDRRIAAGFVFAGKVFDSRPEDQKRINGAASLAHIAMTFGGKQPGDLRWHDGAEDFGWIAQDNSVVAMDAPTVLAFGQAAARWESANIFAARALKNLPEIPVDFAENENYWPKRGEG